jgi:hypothetical protein
LLLLPWLLLLLATTDCGGIDKEGLCDAWANAACPAEYPNTQQGIDLSGCNSNFEFSCGSDNCDAEYEALITCETQNPTCCNDVECNDPVACDALYTTWADCTSRVRDDCE